MTSDAWLILAAVVISGLGVWFYLFWRRDIVNDTLKGVENETNKKAMEDQKEILNAQEKIRDKYDRARDSIPDNWDLVRPEDKLPGGKAD